MKAFCGSFSNPTWIACVYLDFRKLYIVMTKLAKMKVTSVELAMWDLLHMPRTIQKPMLENGITSFPKIYFFCVPWTLGSEQRFNEDKGWLLWGNSYLTLTQFQWVLAGVWGRCVSGHELFCIDFFTLDRWMYKKKGFVELFLLRNEGLMIEGVVCFTNFKALREKTLHFINKIDLTWQFYIRNTIYI